MGSGSMEAGLDPLPDQLPLVFSYRGEGVAEQPTLGRGAVHVRFSGGDRLDPPAEEVVDHLNHVEEGPAQPIQLPNEQQIELPTVSILQEAIQAGALQASPGDDVLIDPDDFPQPP